MAQPAATLGLPWRTDAGTIACSVFSTNLERVESYKVESYKVKSKKK